MRIKAGMIVQIRYSQRHEYPEELRDHLWFVTAEEKSGMNTIHVIRNMTTGVEWRVIASEHTFMPIAPNPCP